MPCIMVLNGSKSGTKYELGEATLRLGRHPECEIVIDVNAVSRFHAQVAFKDHHYLIEDLDSRNGTYVNGKRIDGSVALHDNDRVKICDILFVYRGDADPDELRVEEQDFEEEKATTVVTTVDAKAGSDVMVRVAPEAKLSAVLEISEALGKTLDSNIVFPKILESLFKIFTQADRALIILADPQGKLIPREVKHRRGDEDTVRFSRTIVRRAMDEQMAILSADATSDERFAMSESIADFRIRSVMCAPLLAQDKSPLGVIQIDTQSQKQRFDEKDLQILTSVANQAAIAIENAQMHEMVLNQERMSRELAFARAVQQGFLPKDMPSIEGYSFWAYYEAAGQVGGDYYDFVALPNGSHAVVLGDVSGKGVPAALLMAKATSDTKVALLTYPRSAAEAMGVINNAICSAGVEDKFITVAMCLIDPKENKLAIVNAGHMSPIIRRSEGMIEEPAGDEVSGLPIGIMEDYEYETVETTLNPGDCVVMYSDGVSEAMNSNHQEYTIDRIRSKLRSVELAPDKLGDFLIKDVRAHVAGHRQSDDITLVIFGRNE